MWAAATWFHAIFNSLEPWLAYLVSTITFQGPVLVQLKQRTYRLAKELGSGGYAFVYLAHELPTGLHPSVDTETQYAIKKLVASTPDRLEAAEREAHIQSAAAHPCLLPLLDWAVLPPPPSQPDVGHTVYFLSPAYPDGTLAEELVRLASTRRKPTPTTAGGLRAAVQQAQQPQGCVLSTRQVLGLFRQLCDALDALHKAGYAHRDVKQHNILVRRPKGPPQRATAPAVLAPPRTSVAHAYGGGGGRASATFTLPARSSAHSQDGTEAMVDAKDIVAQSIALLPNAPTQTHTPTSDIEQGYVGHTHTADRGDQYQCVLMDFGSAGPRLVDVKTRNEARLLQEDAEANCTATFRAPELWDVPSPCTLNQGACDVWAAGCTLYAMMYEQSPFQISLNQGGSLALAILNTTLPWPSDPAATYPQPLHDLVTRCLAVEPEARPTPAELSAEASRLLALQPPLPDPSLYTRLTAQ